MTPVFAYLRVSSDGQGELDGFERQERAIVAYCAANGYVVKHVYREVVTGTMDSMDRPVWVEMVGAMLANGVRTIVVEKLDRLARLQGIQEYILIDLEKRGIRVIPVDDPTQTLDDPMRVLYRQIVGAIAQYDRTMIVLKTRAARERIRARGERCEGAKPYGELPGEAFVLDRMKYGRSMGMSIAKITQALNAEGRKPRRGKVWHENTVSRILRRVST